MFFSWFFPLFFPQREVFFPWACWPHVLNKSVLCWLIPVIWNVCFCIIRTGCFILLCSVFHFCTLPNPPFLHVAQSLLLNCNGLSVRYVQSVNERWGSYGNVSDQFQYVISATSRDSNNGCVVHIMLSNNCMGIIQLSKPQMKLHIVRHIALDQNFQALSPHFGGGSWDVLFDPISPAHREFELQQLLAVCRYLIC